MARSKVIDDMRRIDSDSLPYLVEILLRYFRRRIHTFLARLFAKWWGIKLANDCIFNGVPLYRRFPGSRIQIGEGCVFNSAASSNMIGINRPCIISTLRENAEIHIGPSCGLSGAVIGCAAQIVLGKNVWCGANTLITDTDWHTDDPRTSPDKPVVIGDGVWLGVNVTVLKGVHIGENTLVGAGSLVTHSLPANVVAGGVPAKVIKQLTRETRQSK